MWIVFTVRQHDHIARDVEEYQNYQLYSRNELKEIIIINKDAHGDELYSLNNKIHIIVAINIILITLKN